jgi:hypothetical protein
MMEDDFPQYPEQQRSPSSPARWAVFVCAAIVVILAFVVMMTSITETEVLLYTILFLPIMILILYVILRWAQGHRIDSTNITEDEEILEPMRHHALPAERAEGLEMYRCPDCGMSFELVNATPVADKIVLCPICNARLYIK